MATMTQKQERLYVAPLGEAYMDFLREEAYLKNRSMAAEANSLLCSKLVQRMPLREELLRMLANKRGVTVEHLRQKVWTNQATQLSPEEYAILLQAIEQ